MHFFSVNKARQQERHFGKIKQNFWLYFDEPKILFDLTKMSFLLIRFVGLIKILF